MGIVYRFLLSYDDCPKIRELYKDFEMIAVERLNGINNKSGDRKNKMFKELLIANYPIQRMRAEAEGLGEVRDRNAV